jgi:adenylate cyclase
VLGGAFTYAIVDAFTTRGVWLNLAYPGVTIALAYFVTAVAQSLTTERSQRQIRRQFATYVPPGVVNEMTQSPESFKLGGELRDLSILFSDVRSFTTLAQDLGAEKTARLMNVYLTAMTRLIFETRGTLDKYIGDAVVAFWNAPIDVAEHPVRVCEVAIDMQEAIERMRTEQQDVEGVERLKAGIGIHTAEVVVGNLGSELRFDYTITGDGVNLCSRLEGLTKYYGVGILCSEALAKKLPDGFKLRELDTIQVVGKDVPATIFQVVGRGRAEGDEALLHSSYLAALKAFRAGDWPQAETLALETQALATAAGIADGPTQFLLDRVHNSEPPDDWQGVWVFDSK